MIEVAAGARDRVAVEPLETMECRLFHMKL